MTGYQGEFPVDISTSPFATWGPSEWAMYWIGSYGQIDGAHHKQWVLDQVARILKGTEVVVVQARWIDHEGTVTSEYRPTLAEPSAEYEAWVLEMQGEYDEEEEMYEYGYETGVAP